MWFSLCLSVIPLRSVSCVFTIKIGLDWIGCEVDGCVFAIYNVGMMDHAVGVQQRRVSDSVYHVVRFTRDGPNSTLQVDDLPVQYKHPTGKT